MMLKVVSKETLEESTTIELVLRKPTYSQLIDQDLAPGAGAVLKLGEVSRPYSLSSSEANENLHFLIREVEGGEFNQELAEAVPGDYVELEEFFRYFNIENHPEAYYFATGTGIAPFLNALTDPKYPILPKGIFFGAKTQADLVPKKLLELYANPLVKSGGLKYYVSREEATIRSGKYVTEAITPDIISPTAKYYLCGLTDMITEVSSKLVALGVSYDQIAVELFYSKF
jgi:ferredoxin-NADP reductase